MKRLMFFKAAFASAVLLLLCMAPVIASGDDSKRDIILKKVILVTRGVIEMPEASICHEVLTVCYSATGIYSLTVSDSFGAPVYSSFLPADGMEYSYDLSGIGEGTFTLTLEGPSGEYEGVFCIQ